jgi:hypothetical protein
MDVRQRVKWMSGTLVVVLTLAGPLTVGAQPPPRPPGTPLEPYTPAADAKDLKSVLFNWTRNMGMLRRARQGRNARVSRLGADPGQRPIVHAH